MNILFVAAEAAPYAKAGGLADVAGALPRALRQRGHDVRLFMPLYARVRVPEGMTQVFPEHVIQLGPHTYRFALFRANHEDTYFIHCPPVYGRDSLYTNDPDEHLRFLVLQRAALESALRIGFIPDVIHGNDWQCGLIPLLCRTQLAGTALVRARTLLTIHNLGYQGLFGAHLLPDTGLSAWSHLFHQDQLQGGRINFLLHGLLYADGLSTVSPTYAQEILTAQDGVGLDEILRAKSSRLVGILNGIDEDEWDPARDSHIPARYDQDTLDKKRTNTLALLDRVGLLRRSGVPRGPVIGLISRLVWQKGIDLAVDVLPRLLDAVDARVVILGSGESRYEEQCARLARAYPGKVDFTNGYDNPTSHLIEAGADLFLMPSRYEPCGLNQMYSLRYGTIPVVHKTGGLADTVTLWNPATGSGTGFLFDHFDQPGLSWALGAALQAFRDQASFRTLQKNGMKRDFSWRNQARLYEELYRRLTLL